MRHAAFREQVLLARYGVPWHITAGWSAARRAAALIVIGESNGGRFNLAAWQMEWPK